MSPEVEPLGNPEERARRYRRFEQLFSAIGSLGDRINEIIDTEALKLKKEHGPVLSLVIALSFGKALKTLQAIDRLCLMGYGEDALVLLRSNVNLLINTAYILSGPDPTERAKDFLAYSVRERVKFLKNTYQQAPPWQLPMRRMKSRPEPTGGGTSQIVPRLFRRFTTRRAIGSTLASNTRTCLRSITTLPSGAKSEPRSSQGNQMPTWGLPLGTHTGSWRTSLRWS